MSELPSSSHIAPPAKPGNAAAVASLILGILLCIPLLTSVLAIVFAIVGLRKSRSGQAGGRGMAIAGLVLGIVGLAGWSAGAVVSYTLYHKAAAVVSDLKNPGKAVTSSFVRQLSQGDVAGAMRETQSGASRQQAETLALEMKQWGSFKDVAISSWDITTVNGQTELKLGGRAEFSNASKRFTITLAKQGNALRVVDYSFQ